MAYITNIEKMYAFIDIVALYFHKRDFCNVMMNMCFENGGCIEHTKDGGANNFCIML